MSLPVQVRWDVPATMRDGTVLMADVFEPVQSARPPVLVMRTPYDKRRHMGIDVLGYARNGFLVVVQDVRGSFASEGEWVPWRHERDDSYDTVEWAAGLGNGRVGMLGSSYVGSTQWSAAITRAPHLTAINPTMAWSDPEDGLMFRGGATELGLNAFWSLGRALPRHARSDVTGITPADRAGRTVIALDGLAEAGYWALPARKPAALSESQMPDIGVTRALDDPSSLGESRVAGRYDDVETPALITSGWYDVFLQGALDNFAGLRAVGKPARLIVGPWHHTSLESPSVGQVGDVNFGLGSTMPGGRTPGEIQQEWNAHWLMDAPAGPLHTSGALVFVMGANVWREVSEWPPARAASTPLYLHADGRLGWEAPTADGQHADFVDDPNDPPITHGGNLAMSGEFPPGPRDQARTEAREDVLVFTTAPLTEEVEITGRVTATLHATSDAPSSDWVVRLCTVDSAGVSRNLVDGIRRIDMEPGQPTEVVVDLWSTCVVVPAGHRLRVHVTSASFPRWDRNPHTGESSLQASELRIAHQRLWHDRARPSLLTLPLIGAGRGIYDEGRGTGQCRRRKEEEQED